MRKRKQRQVEPVIRLKLECPRDKDHAKIIQLHASLGVPIARILGELLSGTSDFYIHPPQERSPIGRCLVCGDGPLFYTIEEFNGDVSIQGVQTEARASR